MPKMKTNRGAAKRFKRTGTGALKRGRTNRRHILTKKSQKRKRNLRDCMLVKTADLRSAKRLLREE